ncbi:glycosyltransferase family 2 protein [Anabaena sp. PCC 7108]|uniref:glycosyltransferase family 2 protein n=1 Tax=Anabaena sp. PCC 7108 TaxID=163908 RepID=UPI0003479F69|nr:glycosyltransferase family 2 protein [Anabaena sp. PCC 7108]
MKPTQPLITIGISTYNRYISLKDYSLSSIEKLTYQNYEVIIVDDGSSDETPQILSEYQDKLHNLQIFCNDKNRGTPFSRNRILEKAKGDIIVFIDDDVSIFPNCLEEIIKVYTQDSQVMFIWGCVYQCHGSNDRNAPTFGTGSLFSIRRIIADCFRFDTNIRYLKTYVCEEHDFARRVQSAGAKIIKVQSVKANHYQAPSRNRYWRGLGGHLNYLYEQMKQDLNSINMYYFHLFLGVILVIKSLLKIRDVEKNMNDYQLKEAVFMFHHLLILIKERKFLLAGKSLFYITIDIPIRAKIKNKMEIEQAKKFTENQVMTTT